LLGKSNSILKVADHLALSNGARKPHSKGTSSCFSHQSIRLPPIIIPLCLPKVLSQWLNLRKILLSGSLNDSQLSRCFKASNFMLQKGWVNSNTIFKLFKLSLNILNLSRFFKPSSLSLRFKTWCIDSLGVERGAQHILGSHDPLGRSRFSAD
jgi:hypothetical protein